jgi:PAS domain S-box-containing protein
MYDIKDNPGHSEGPDSIEDLRRSEERFRLMVESVRDYAIFMLDPQGYVKSWNMGAERIKGYKAEEIIGHHFSEFYPEEAINRGWPQYELQEARARGRFEDEGWRIRKDGSSFWANVIITALYDTNGELRGFAKVTRDMTDRKRMESLEVSERRMLEFLAMLSHELRNPLAPIRNAIYMMNLKEVADPEMKWAIDVIDRQATQLTRLVDDLLEVSRVTSGNITLHKELLDLSAPITRAIEGSRPLIDARRHRLEVIIPDEPLIVEGDLTRLTQIVVNLLNNAAKYTPEGGEIQLRVVRQETLIRIHVSDNGTGIAEDSLQHIFDLFVQGKRTLDRSEGGLGIGLTLVRRLVEMHGGSVTAISAGPGKGSEFIVTFPRRIVGSTEAVSGDGVTDYREAKNRELRVLVVDDNRDAANTMEMFLKAWGYDTCVVYDGQTALETAREYHPHIVLLDIGLPGLSGYEVAEHIRQFPNGDKIELIALTGYGQEEDRQRTQNIGISHHLIKPIDPHKLRDLLAEVKK